MSLKRLITGFKPTGYLHLGNYIGVMKNLTHYSNEYESFIFIPDYHALTNIKNKEELAVYSAEAVKAVLSLELNEKTVIFKQSAVPEVTELAWIFNCLISVPTLSRAHAYKDALANNISANVGLFTYPILMAADILIYDCEVVPVGKDQFQHVEYARILAKKFNNIYGRTFSEPQPLSEDETSLLPGTDGRKMSKSYHNTIGLFDSPEETTKKVMSIITDSKSPNESKDYQQCNIFALHQYFSRENLAELKKRYVDGQITYRESKEILAANINRELEKIRSKKKELDKNEDYIKKITAEGAKKARQIARAKMEEVRAKIGLV